MDKIKTLSAAIRYGSKLKPQVHNIIIGRLFVDGEYLDEHHIGTCAIGAAWDAIRTAKGQGLDLSDWQNSNAAYSDIQSIGVRLGQIVEHPEDHHHYHLSHVIVSLNDSFRWTREAIADWLESQGL